MSWYSNLVSKTSSQISSLKSTLLSGEADGDTDDDTHVCRALRGYYLEKGRPFPPWLPPDPKAASQPPPQPLLVNNNVGQRYGSPGAGAGQQPAGGLSSLWDNGPSSAPPAPPSLRAGGRTPASLQPGGDIQRRPVPGQRAGSYNSAASSHGRPDAASVPPGVGGGGAGAGVGGGATSAQALLRQRLWGGGARTTSPQGQGGGSSQGPFAPPASGGGGGGGNYEDRFAPGGTYDNGGSGGGGGVRRQGLPSGPRGYR